MSKTILRLNQISHQFNENPLFRNITTSISVGDKIGLIGQNGSGKTTLLNIICSELQPNQGQIDNNDIEISFVPQIIDLKDDTDLPILDFCLKTKPKYYSLYQTIQNYENSEANDLDSYLDAVTEFQETGGYEFINNIRILFTKYNFIDNSENIKIGSLSEGQVRFVYLVTSILEKSDLLILDEPTNHVDEKLKETYIKAICDFQGSVISVSHDRELLSQTCNKIWEIEGGELEEYNGNWEFYKEEYETRLATKLNQSAKNQTELERLNDLLERTYKGETESKVSQIQKRINRLENKIDNSAKIESQKVIDGSITYEGKSSHFLVRLKDVSIQSKERTLIKKLSVDIKTGDKISLNGSNGSGKSTLVKTILEKCNYVTYSGEIILSPSIKAGYFEQGINFDDENISLFDYIKKECKSSDNKTFGLIKKYQFTKDQKDSQIWKLSGGERNRLHLMNLIEGNYNILFLDEPTNHLDLISIEALEEMLNSYNGAIVLISHDKYFRKATTQKTICIE